MNYITHLNTVFQQFAVDSRLNPTHISLYMALFQYWNINRFPKRFHINREEMMQLSKIGSKATYHRCIKNLSDWNYVNYLPSHNPYKGSQIKMFIFGTSSDTSSSTTNGITTEPSNEQVVIQALVPNTNYTKQIGNNSKRKLPKNDKEVLIFFQKQKWPPIEAKKFFNHYNSIGWKVGGKIKIMDWHSTAENWMLKAQEIKAVNGQSKNNKHNNFENEDFLKTKKEKNYSEPL